MANVGGFVEMWFNGLTPNRHYLISIAVSGWWLNNSSAFNVSSSGGLFASYVAELFPL